MGELANKHPPAGRVENQSAGWQFIALHEHSMAIKCKLITMNGHQWQFSGHVIAIKALIDRLTPGGQPAANGPQV